MGLTEFIADHATAFINEIGYAGVFVLMILESMVFPIPSEAVMPFAGFLIETGTFTFTGVILASTLGSIVGSLLSYWIGQYGGKPFIAKYGKYLLLDERDLAFTESFFAKRGEITIFVSRFIPVVRHLISIPAGIGQMSMPKFLLYTILGAGMWNAILTVAGYYLKQNWDAIMEYSHAVDIVVVVLLGLAVAFFVYKHLGRARKRRSAGPNGSKEPLV